MAPALQEAVDAKVPVVTVDRRVPSVTGILGHVGADNVKGGEAQGELIEKMFPNGATIINLQGQSGASPAIDRNKGLHNVLDKAKDKYKIVFEQTAGFDRAKGLSVTEAALAGMATPPQVIVAANDDMALGALEAVKARNLKGIVIIGFDALPETLGKIRDGETHRDDRAVPRQAERDRRRHPGRLPQERDEARAADHASDAGGDHQGQSQHGRAPQRSEVAASAARWRAVRGAPSPPLSSMSERSRMANAPAALSSAPAKSDGPILKMTGVSKRFPGVLRARERSSRSRAVGDPRAPRRERRRQVDAAQDPVRRAERRCGRNRAVRRAGRLCDAPRRPARRHRHDLPGVHPRPRHDDRRERVHRPRTRLEAVRELAAHGRGDEGDRRRDRA